MTEHFTNEGYGWTCQHCRDIAVEGEARAEGARERARFFHEGEAEGGSGGAAALSSRALARWRSPSPRRVLYCPLCGVEEELREE